MAQILDRFVSYETQEYEPLALEEGMLARFRNEPESANPYRGRGPRSNFYSWQAGWNDADRELTRKR